MKKKQFLKQLKSSLSRLPAGEKRERLDFYSEIIDDKIEEGMTEEEALKDVGSVNEIAVKILNENKLLTKVEKKEKRPLTAGEKVVMIIGAPLWIPIAIACAAIIFSGYVVAYALLLTLWAIELPFLLIAFLSRALYPLCLGATRALSTFTAKSAGKLTSIFKG